MIGYLSGTIIDKHGDHLWLDVQGVGYRIRSGLRLREQAIVGEPLSMYIHTHVREGALELFGFENRQALLLFEIIISVSGIGPKIGLKIIGSSTVDRIKQAVQTADIAFFQGIPGIGKKGAQRIIVDLKGKLPVLKDLDLSDDAQDPVIDALMQFGFARSDIQRILSTLDSGLSEEDQIRQGLKALGRK